LQSLIYPFRCVTPSRIPRYFSLLEAQDFSPLPSSNFSQFPSRSFTILCPARMNLPLPLFVGPFGSKEESTFAFIPCRTPPSNRFPLLDLDFYSFRWNYNRMRITRDSLSLHFRIFAPPLIFYIFVCPPPDYGTIDCKTFGSRASVFMIMVFDPSRPC